MAKIVDYFKIITPSTQTAVMQDNQNIDNGGALYGNYSWYQRIVQGSASRLARYREYDVMDSDVEVARALDIIADEITPMNEKTNLPFDIDFKDESGKSVDENTVITIREALAEWCKLQDLKRRRFKTARLAVKFGDCAFIKKSPFDKWEWLPTSCLVSAVVSKEDITKIVGYYVRTDTKTADFVMSYNALGTQADQQNMSYVPATNIVRFSINDDMSEMAPFGDSVLRPVYKVHKQKELLEDAILIYRIQRAPERRVFYIDVGKMNPALVNKYLEGVKNDVRQKKVPSQTVGGQESVDSIYNPTSMMEDYFFAVRPDAKTRVETLPGGGGLGEINDLQYFSDRVLRGLRVPISWLKPGTDGAMFNDGKLGAAYVEEQQFSKFIDRNQTYFEVVYDSEFKMFLRACNILVDPNCFELKLPKSSSFEKYKQAELDAVLLNLVSNADGIAHLSKRFVQSRFMQLSEDEILTNERLWRQEHGIDDSTNKLELYKLMYGGASAEGGTGGMFVGDIGGPPMGGESIEPPAEGEGGTRPTETPATTPPPETV